MKSKTSSRLVAFIAYLALAVTAARAGTFSIAPWTDDISTSIALGRTVWAYHFGAITTASFSVPTPGVAGPNASNANFDLTGMTSFLSDASNNITGAGSAVMAHDFVYGANPASVTVKGLIAGRNYVVSFFSVGWVDGGDANFRTQFFSSGADNLYVRQGEFGTDNGIRIDYAFTATATTQVITIALSNPNNATFHLYGLALHSPSFVSNTNDAGAGSLRQALADAAGIVGPDTITFSPALSGATITLASEIVFNDPSRVSIDASSLPTPVTIHGGPGTNRIFSVSSGKTLALTGLMLTGGNGGGTAQNGNGNAIVNFGTLSLTRCTLFGNTSANGSGGAILNDGGTLTLTQCTLAGNSTTRGGAILQTTGTLTLTQCALTGNTASDGRGGAISKQNGSATLTQCTLAGNQALGGDGDGWPGGAISQENGTLSLTHCTLVGNAGSDGGGVNVFGGTVTLAHCIVAENTAFRNYPDLSAAAVNLTGVNFIGDPDGSGLTASATLLTTAANGSIKLSPLGNYGGPTQTMPPLTGSPAIDGAVGSPAATDQRGLPIAGVPDLGAVEIGTRVTTTADDPTPPTGIPVSLRQAVGDCPTGGVIDFAPALSGQTLSLNSEIAPTQSSLRIDASNLPSGVTIDGGPGTNRIFSVSSGKSLALLGLTLTGGNGGGAVQNGNGNAILNRGTLALTRCTLSGNTRASGSGGAILNDGGTLTATQSTLSGNSTTNGGAIFQTTGTLTLAQCALTGNTATNAGRGGAIYKQGGTASLTQCTLFGNQALSLGQTPSFGGAIAHLMGTLSLTHCTLVGNAATFTGGIDVTDGAVTLANCIVAGNTGDSNPDIFSTFVVNVTGVNFIGDPAGSGLTASAAILTTAANGPINLSPLGSNGGPTQTMVPRPGSPAIDRPSFIAGATTDQRGFPRPLENGPSGELPDIGAVEFQTAVVTTAADQLDTPTGAQTSLREALRDGADRVLFNPTLAAQVIGVGSELSVAKYVTIDASGFASGITVSGNNVSRVFHIAPGVSAEFVRLIIAGGRAATSGFPSGYGGGAYVEGALTLTECTLQGNSAYVGAGAYLANNGTATLTLNRSTVSGNSASYGGGIQNEGTLIATSSTFAENAASVEGGAISAPFNKPVTLRHCTVSLNSAPTGGGVSGNVIQLNNSILSGNSGANGPDVFGSFTPTGVNFIGGTVLLAPLGDYGGPTKTMALRPGSNARNLTFGTTVTTDQRGFPIVAAADCGAYETGTLAANYNAYIWETLPTAGNGTFTDPLHAATFDFDGDGASNFNEWLAQTDASSAVSVFRIISTVINGPHLDVTFTTSTNRHYSVEYGTDLTGWTPLPGSVTDGTGAPVTVRISPVSGFPRLFARARVGP